nr:uncharacterized protein LOC113808104 isoform X2 [Penaeus vannamei]
MAFLIPPLLEIASATALTAFGWKVAEEIPNAIRAFKDDGGGQVREYDQRLLDAMKEIEQQKIENQKKQDELMMAMMNTVLRLQDTSRSSPDHKETRKQMAKEMRKIIEENMPKKKGKACFKVLQNRMQLQCNVCMEIYNTKERLVFPHCGHTFSQDCLKKISRKKVFKCPFCRQDKDRFENLRVNHAIMSYWIQTHHKTMTKTTNVNTRNIRLETGIGQTTMMMTTMMITSTRNIRLETGIGQTTKEIRNGEEDNEKA